MKKIEKLKAELDRLNVRYDPDAHWKTLEKLLAQANEVALENPPEPEREPAGLIERLQVEVSRKGTSEPLQDPRYGDKTPAVVQWRRENWSVAQFASVYQGRKLP